MARRIQRQQVAAILFFGAALATRSAEPVLSLEQQAVLSHISADSLRGNLSFLASDLLEGRATPSRGLDLAAEYLAAQFLVLFGQMSYPDYNRFMGARALGLIAHKLKKANFGQSQSSGGCATHPHPSGPHIAGCAL